MEKDTWSTYKYTRLDDESMKCYVKVRTDLEIENGLLYCRIRFEGSRRRYLPICSPQELQVACPEFIAVTNSAI